MVIGLASVIIGISLLKNATFFACDLKCCYRCDCIQGLCGNRYKAWYAVERFEAHYSGIVPHHSGAWNG